MALTVRYKLVKSLNRTVQKIVGLLLGEIRSSRAFIFLLQVFISSLLDILIWILNDSSSLEIGQ
jgi:hypothetical protein